VIVFSIGISLSAMAQDSGGQKSTPSKAPEKSQVAGVSMDSKFVKEAAGGGLAEVEKGNLAKSKASNDAVKQFGDRMVTDHSKANDELKSLASSKGWQLPTEMPPHEKSMHTQLSKLSGVAFDKAYISDMVRDHEKDVAAFKKCAANCSDPDLKAWAQKTVPTLEDHLKMAKDAASQVGVSTTAEKDTASLEH
jgi:putative membrane protein